MNFHWQLWDPNLHWPNHRLLQAFRWKKSWKAWNIWSKTWYGGSVEPCVHRRNFAASGNWLSLWDPAKVCEMTLRDAPDQTLKKLPIFPLFVVPPWNKLSLIADMPTDPPTTAELPAVQIWLGLANRKESRSRDQMDRMSGRWIHSSLVFLNFCADKNPEIDSGTSGNTPLVKMWPCRDSCCIESSYINLFQTTDRQKSQVQSLLAKNVEVTAKNHSSKW